MVKSSERKVRIKSVESMDEYEEGVFEVKENRGFKKEEDEYR